LLRRREAAQIAGMTARFESLDQAAASVRSLDLAAAGLPPGEWPLWRVLAHCAQSLEYGIDGFPRMKPAIVRATIGRLVLRRFLARGEMRHSHTADIAGAEALVEISAEAARERLLQAIERFRAASTTAPHFVYGEVAKADYERVQAMHIADHLGALQRP
jgi:Protein of unknown function (DUF1569)